MYLEIWVGSSFRIMQCDEVIWNNEEIQAFVEKSSKISRCLVGKSLHGEMILYKLVAVT